MDFAIVRILILIFILHLVIIGQHVISCNNLNLQSKSTKLLEHSNSTKLKQKATSSAQSSVESAKKKEKNLQDFGTSLLEDFPLNGDIDYDSVGTEIKPELLIPKQEREKTMLPESEIAFKQMHERAQFIRIEEIKSSILSKLRLLAPPNVTALKMGHKLKKYPEHILPHALEDKAMQSDHTESEKDDFHAQISTVIQFGTQLPETKLKDSFPIEDIAYFEIPLSVSKKNLQKAVLLSYIQTPKGKSGTKIQLKISAPLHKTKLLAVRDVILSPKGHWEHIDITHQVREWAADDGDNYGLILTAELDGVNVVNLSKDNKPMSKEEDVSMEAIEKRPDRGPLIKMTLNENEGRHKRSFDEVPLSCDVEDREKRCCRYKFVMDFERMGPEFDFILQPKRFLANYCAGTCPTYYLPPTIGDHLMRGISASNIQRCCTPTKKKPLEILYIDDSGNLVTGLLPSMTIEKCDCS